MEENQIIAARLRSESGRVYSSGLTVDTPNITTIVEESINDPTMPIRKQQPCSESECCKNTAKIVNMIAELQQSVKEIKQSTDSQAMVGASHAGQIRRVEDKIHEQGQEIKDLDEEMTDYKFQLKLLTNIVIRQDQQIAALSRKMNDMQQREMYSNLVISGITEKPGENPMKVYNQFITEQLEIQELIPVNRAYRIGTGSNRPLIVELRDPVNYKPKIYQNAGKLKGKTNSNGGKYFISDHLPEEYNENRRRINDLITDNKKKKGTEQRNMIAKKGRLFIEEQLYQKAIHPPTPEELMKPNQQMSKLADEIDMVRAKDITEQKSKFIAYAAAVHDLRDVQAAYIKVRTKFADATHVVCAFRVNGDHTATHQDYVDDGEYGAGRVLLGALKQEKLMNIVLFMIRYHGGKNLGSIRFDIFKEIALGAIANLRKRVEEIQKEQQEQAEEQNRKHQEYIQQQRENPSFPVGDDEWSKAPEENWELENKKAK